MSSPNNTRSASTTPADATKKKFACSHPGCGKSFSRSEHLHRHSLNHKEGTNTCTRCSAHFRRRDLLDRHMARHKEKDDEAGGEGLGHLATRKRLWRDENGKIIQGRRPYKQDGEKRRQSSSASSDQSYTSQSKRSRTIEMAPPSPPHSNTSRQLANEAQAELILQDPWPMESSETPSTESAEQFDFLCNPGWGAQQPFQQNIMSDNSVDLPFEDIFKPDTAMSFNPSFTNTSYYNWLFESDGLGTNTTVQDDSVLAQERMPVISAAPSYASSPEHMSDSLSPTSLDPNLLSHHDYPEPPFSILVNDVGLTKGASFTTQQALLTPPLLEDQTADEFSRTQAGSFPIDFSSNMMSKSFSDIQLRDSPYQGIHTLSPPSSQRSSCIGSPILPDAYLARTIGKLPVITNEARDGLMQIIRQSRPTKPNGSDISCSDPLLSLLSLQHYLDLFFTRFNTTYPLIHQATFRSSEVHPFLLMAILLLGATYSDKEAQLLAVCIHDIMRPLIHSNKDFNTRPQSWVMQTILLTECFGKNRAGEKQQDMSQLYHGLLLNLIRRTDNQTPNAPIPPYNPETQSLDEYWLEAVAAEQKRRYEDLIPVL